MTNSKEICLSKQSSLSFYYLMFQHLNFLFGITTLGSRVNILGLHSEDIILISIFVFYYVFSK